MQLVCPDSVCYSINVAKTEDSMSCSASKNSFFISKLLPSFEENEFISFHLKERLEWNLHGFGKDLVIAWSGINLN